MAIFSAQIAKSRPIGVRTAQPMTRRDGRSRSEILFGIDQKTMVKRQIQSSFQCPHIADVARLISG